MKSEPYRSIPKMWELPHFKKYKFITIEFVVLNAELTQNLICL
ncbi:hypothetical protein LEP1GSC172_1884 [Leptospira noguchii]|uniref:Uncharacterized protein n=1 Tax=Leptospira noguchii TaxID=28182 RepID=M6VV47_9LEPT|nr:hypothetical protein LEP1GSC172_1884 [Leptospira noguchii]